MEHTAPKREPDHHLAEHIVATHSGAYDNMLKDSDATADTVIMAQVTHRANRRVINAPYLYSFMTLHTNILV